MQILNVQQPLASNKRYMVQYHQTLQCNATKHTKDQINISADEKYYLLSRCLLLNLSFGT